MLHVIVHAAPRELTAGGDFIWRQQTLAALDCPATRLHAPLTVTFEAAFAQLERLPQMFCEPDGWFDWTSPPHSAVWQLAGQLHDRGPQLGHVEVKITGALPTERWDEFCAALGWPAQRLVLQLVSAGVVLEEASFRQLLELHRAAVIHDALGGGGDR
ncbi:MAG TPA: hypothetical protein VL096_17020 [Pirellulaceae bacterium]|nr:hypothetical protein [Pirellulaceae bacterium]